MFDYHRRKTENAKKAPTKGIDHKEYEHRQALNVMIKVIRQCEMPEHLKIIMVTRIWGVEPDEFQPLTAFQIAYLNKGGRRLKDRAFKYGRVPTEEEVLMYDPKNMPRHDEINRINEYEKTGKFYCQQLLLARQSQEIVDKFNENPGKNKNAIFTKNPFEKKSFKV